MSSALRRALIALNAATGLAAVAGWPVAAQEYKAGGIRIEAPWLRATPTGAQVAGGYMKLQNAGSEADRLVGGSTAIAGGFEIHEMGMAGGVMTMRELPKGLEVPPGQSVELKPGSYHIMLLDLKRQLKDGDKVKGTLQFEKAGKVEVEYAVRGIGSRGGAGQGGASGHDAHGADGAKKR
jgi:copper(I)-binding protein